MAALAGVVVDHVQDHLDARLVQGLDHGLELADLLAEGAAAGVPDIRCEEPDGVVPPVVGQPSFHQVPVRHELVDGEQLHRRDPQRSQIIHGCRARQAGVGSPQRLRHVGAAGGESLRVHLVDHGLVPRDAWRAIVPPGECRIDHHALGRMGGAVARVQTEVGIRMPYLVSEQGVVPLDRPVDGFGVGVQEQLVRIEPVPCSRVVRSVHPVAVPLARPRFREVDMPDEVGLLGHPNLRELLTSVVSVEEAQLHARRVLREQGKVHPRAIPGGAQRIRVAGTRSHAEPFGAAAAPCRRMRRVASRLPIARFLAPRWIRTSVCANTSSLLTRASVPVPVSAPPRPAGRSARGAEAFPSATEPAPS